MISRKRQIIVDSVAIHFAPKWMEPHDDYAGQDRCNILFT